MSTIKFKGNEVALKGEMPAEGTKAPDFTFVKEDLSEQSLYDMNESVKVLIGVPSLDTGVCAMEAKAFNRKLKDKEGVQGIVVSKDLPFAMKRFCEAEGVDNVMIASDFRYGDFCNEYGTEMAEGPLKGLSARAVFVLDKDNKVVYMQLVPEVTDEPDYDKVIEAIDEIS